MFKTVIFIANQFIFIPKDTSDLYNQYISNYKLKTLNTIYLFLFLL